MLERGGRWLRLGAVILVTVLIWTGFLPRIEHQRRIQSYIQHLERQGIDPAATFYTDLEGMPDWEASIRERLGGSSGHQAGSDG